MIVEREEEIEAFIAREYWSIEARAARIRAGLHRPLRQTRRREVRAVHASPTATDRRRPRANASKPPPVGAARHRRQPARSASAARRRRSSPPPCSRKRRASSASPPAGPCRSRRSCTKASRSASEGTVGLISYMRTDSTHLSGEALARTARRDRARLRHARAARQAERLQDQVEERAGSARSDPPDLRRCARRRRSRKFLSDDERRLYELIWKRAVACADGAGHAQHRQRRAGRRQRAQLPRHRHHRGRSRASWPCTRKARTARRRRRRRRRPQAAADDERPTAYRSTASTPTSISPSRRRASPKPRW